MGAEVEAQVWCDGPWYGRRPCVAGDNSETGTGIGTVRAFLRDLGWKVRRKDGITCDICKICIEWERSQRNG